MDATIKKLKAWARTRTPRLWGLLTFTWWRTKMAVPWLEPQIFRRLRRAVSQVSGLSLAPVAQGQRILFFEVAQSLQHLAWSGVIARALHLRGHQCTVIGCDQMLQRSCNAGYTPGLRPFQCALCYLFAHKYHSLARLPILWLSCYIDHDVEARAKDLVNQLPPGGYETFQYKGFPLGNMVKPAVVHFMRTGIIDLERKETQEAYLNFLQGAVVMVDACERLLEEIRPDKVVMLNGLGMRERVMYEVSRRRGIHVVVYEVGFLPNTLVFYHNKTIDYEFEDNWNRLKDTPLSLEERRRLTQYLAYRTAGKEHQMDYWLNMERDHAHIALRLGIDGQRPLAVLFPNITWDTAVYQRDRAFRSMYEWLEETVAYFVAHPEYQLVVRAHPAEAIIPGAMYDSIVSRVRRAFPNLPPHIKLIMPKSRISSYALMEMADLGLVYTSSTGLEMALLGKPVLVAAEVHYRGKGFTWDPATREEYFTLLQKLLDRKGLKLSAEALELARRYAYLCFFRASIPIRLVNYKADSPLPYLALESLEDLLPGKDPYLDLICDAILTGDDFVLQPSRADTAVQLGQCGRVGDGRCC